MHPLDDPTTYSRLDPSGLLGRIRDLPRQCRRAWGQATATGFPPQYRQAGQVVVLGMGGSAIGGDLLRDAVAHECPLPIRVFRDYALPADVGAGALVIASSYSGETEETLASFQEAARRGAHLAVVTGGGRLQALARERSLPLLTIDYEGEPRAVLGFSFFLLLGLLYQLELVGDKSREVEEVGRVLEGLNSRLGPEVPLERNPAKDLATALQGRLAVVYGAGILEGAARRWKGQVNENAKAWAFFETFPELDHNAVVGYDWPRDLADRILVVLLYGDLLHPRTKNRYQITREILERKGIGYRVVVSQGESILSQMMSSVLTGDYVSYYLAVLSGVDPSPVEVISFLKERLKSID